MKKDNMGNVNIAEMIQRRINNNSLDTKGCGHISQIKDVIPSAEGCEDCLKIGDEWVFLRLCWML